MSKHAGSLPWVRPALTVAFVIAAVTVAARRLALGTLIPNNLLPTFPVLDAAAAAAWCLIGAAVVLRAGGGGSVRRWLILGAAVIAGAELASSLATSRIVDLATNPFTFGTAAGRAQLLFAESVGSVVRLGTAIGAAILASGLLVASAVARPRRPAVVLVGVLIALAAIQVLVSLTHVLTTVARAGTLQTTVLSAGVLLVQTAAFAFLALVAIGGAQAGVRPVRGWWLVAVGAVIPFTQIWVNAGLALLSPVDAVNVVSLSSATQLLAAVLLIGGFWLGVPGGGWSTEATKPKGRE